MVRIKGFSLAVLISVPLLHATAEGAPTEAHLPISPEMVEAEINSAKAEFSAELKKRGLSDDAPLQAPPLEEQGRIRPELEKLAGQVESLRNQIVVEHTANLATQTPKRIKVSGGRSLFTYKPDAIYEVSCAPERITDIQLKPGESLTSPPMAGDTARWSVAIMKSGIGGLESTHVIVKPLDDESDTNLIIATDQHLYHLRLRTTQFHQPFVSWKYPEDNKAIVATNAKKKSQGEPSIALDGLNFAYDVEGDDYKWKPLRVFDDGKKTFIQMKPDMKVSEAPVLFLTDEEDNTMLVNYRVKGSYYVVDRLFEKGELRVGKKAKVTIEAHKERNLLERLFNL